MTKPTDPRAAREQAAEFCGFLASKSIPIPGGDPIEIPNPALLDEDQQERVDDLQMLLERCDKEPDEVIPSRTIHDSDGDEIVIPETTIKGGFKFPLRIDGERLKPHFDVQRAIAYLGEAEYKRFKAAGGKASDIKLHLRQMELEMEGRLSDDPKSVAGGVSVETVSGADSV